MGTTKTNVSIRVKPEDAEFLTATAYAKDMSLSAFVRGIVEEWLQKNRPELKRRTVDYERLMRAIEYNWGCKDCASNCVDKLGVDTCEIHTLKRLIEEV